MSRWDFEGGALLIISQLFPFDFSAIHPPPIILPEAQIQVLVSVVRFGAELGILITAYFSHLPQNSFLQEWTMTPPLQTTSERSSCPP